MGGAYSAAAAGVPFNRGPVESGSPSTLGYTARPDRLDYYGAAERLYGSGHHHQQQSYSALGDHSDLGGPEEESAGFRFSVESIPDRPALYVRNRAGGSGYSDPGAYKVVCYYSGWAVYRPDPFTFTPSHVEPRLCTHVIYSFAGLEEHTHRIKVLDEEVDLVQGENTRFRPDECCLNNATHSFVRLLQVRRGPQEQEPGPEGDDRHRGVERGREEVLRHGIQPGEQGQVGFPQINVTVEKTWNFYLSFSPGSSSQ